MQNQDEVEGSDAMTVSYVDSFKVSTEKTGTPPCVQRLDMDFYQSQYASDNVNMETLQNALFMKFEGTLGPKPIPAREQAMQASQAQSSTILHGTCFTLLACHAEQASSS